MSKFINKNYVNTVSSLIDNSIEIMRNNSYVFNNMKPVTCVVYNPDETGSTLDAGAKFEYTALGPDSPFRFNKINDAVVYTNDMKIIMNIDLTEEGLTASPIEFEIVVIPDTFIPLPNGYIIFDQLTKMDATKKYLFMMDQVTPDTIDNGANFYRVHLTLKSVFDKDYKYLEDQVINEYTMIIDNAGTSMKTIVKQNDYNLISSVDDVLTRIKTYYLEMFYNDAVQTFTFDSNSGLYYDPYMIEFLIRNNVFKYTGNDYIFVDHAVPVHRTFSIDYDKTIFRALETCDIDRFNLMEAVAQPIENRNTLFATVPDDYFMIDYEDRATFGVFIPFDNLMINMVHDNVILDIDIPQCKYNPLVTYFHGDPMPSNILKILEDIDLYPSAYNFYFIPMLIFVLESYMGKLMKST